MVQYILSIIVTSQYIRTLKSCLFQTKASNSGKISPLPKSRPLTRDNKSTSNFEERELVLNLS